jgi:spore germination cell wall hydrolase CwlJ-like protein
MGEAADQGHDGMVAVANVIVTRCKEKNRTPFATVRKQGAFGCLRLTLPDQLITKWMRQPGWDEALEIAKLACNDPRSLPDLTHGATHYKRVGTEASWATGLQPVAVVKDHEFFKGIQY